MDELRPVEKLCLMVRSKKEQCTYTDVLAAILAYLYYCEYIELGAKSLNISLAGASALKSQLTLNSGILRKYEVEILKIIQRNDSVGLICAIMFGNFDESFVGLGLYRVEIGGGWFFKEKKIVATELLDHCLEQIGKERETIDGAIGQKKLLGPREMMMGYAFPSLIFGNEYSDMARCVAESCPDDRIKTAVMVTVVARAIWKRAAELAKMNAMAQLDPRYNTGI